MLRTALESIYIFSVIYLVLIYYKLCKNVIFLRRKSKTTIGYKNKKLERAVRAHSNFCETVPFILLISFILYFNNLLLFCVPMLIILIFGRTIHARAISNLNEKLEERRIGMKLTFYSLYIGLAGLIFYISQLIYFTLQASINTTILPQYYNLPA